MEILHWRNNMHNEDNIQNLRNAQKERERDIRQGVCKAS